MKKDTPFSVSQTIDKPRDASKGPQALRFFSAGGGMYVAEEQPKVASHINFWP